MIKRLKRRLALALAHWRVRRGRAQRICVPAQFVVWRDGDGVLSKDLRR